MYVNILLYLSNQSKYFQVFRRNIDLGGHIMCKISAHYRRAHMVRGHFRNTKYGRVWIGSHMRDATIVNDHCIVE